MAKWRDRRKMTRYKGRHDACKHVLPRAWSKIMCVKQWRTTSEVTDRTSASAWRWLRQFAPGGAPRAGIGLQDAMLSRWILPMAIFKKLGDDSPYMASMGRGKWSILAWPMNTEPCADPDRRRFYFNMREETKPEWQAVLDLDDYEVVPYSPMLTEGLTICLEQNGVAEPLAKSGLRAAGLLSHADLVLAALRYNLDVMNKTRAQLLALLAQHVAPGDSDFKALVAKDVAPSDVLALLPSDPLFEVTWDEMETDDKQEFGDVKKAVDRHKAKATYHLHRRRKLVDLRRRKLVDHSLLRRPLPSFPRRRPGLNTCGAIISTLSTQEASWCFLRAEGQGQTARLAGVVVEARP